MTIDDNSFNLVESSIVSVAPNGVRQIRALDKGLVFLCIQAKDNSLEQFTMTDGKVIA